MDGEKELKVELADMLADVVKDVVKEVLPKESITEDIKKEVDLDNYIKKDEVEKFVSEKLDSYKKAVETKKAMVEPTYYGAGNPAQQDYNAISRAKEYGIDIETWRYKDIVKLPDSDVEIKSDRQKADTEMAALLYKAVLDKDYVRARKIEAEFADPQSLANKEKTLLAGSGSGSYTVPVGYEAVLIERRDEAFPIIDKLNRMTTNELTGYVPYEVSMPAVYWETEGADIRVSQPVWSTHLYSVKEQRSTTILSQKLMMSSNIDVMAKVASEQGRALGSDLYGRMVTGTGLYSLPLGLGYISVPATQSIVVAKGIVSFTAYSVAYNNITSLAWTLPAEYAQDAVWMMNPEMYRKIIAARDTTGRSIFDDQTSNYLRSGNKPTLLGRPVYENRTCGIYTNTKTKAINQVFYFVPRYYTIVTMKGIAIDIWDQATVGGVNLAGQRSKAISTSNYLTMFSTSPYAFVRISQIGATDKPS